MDTTTTMDPNAYYVMPFEHASPFFDARDEMVERTPLGLCLHYEQIHEPGMVECMRRLLARGADPLRPCLISAPDPPLQSRIPLVYLFSHYISHYSANYFEMVKMLLEYDSTALTVPNEDDDLVLDCVFRIGNRQLCLDTLEYLLRYYAYQLDLTHALQNATQHIYDEQVCMQACSMLLRAGALPHGDMLLVGPVERGQLGLTHLLLDARADPNATHPVQGWYVSPLYQAASRHNLDMLHLLLSYNRPLLLHGMPALDQLMETDTVAVVQQALENDGYAGPRQLRQREETGRMPKKRRVTSSSSSSDEA